MRKIIAIILFVSLSMVVLANGWHITTRYYNLPEGQRNSRTEEVFLYKGFMKMVNGNLTTVFDLSKGEIIYINTENKTYWKGNPKRFNTEVRAELEAQIEDKLYGVEMEQQDAMRAMYKEMIDASFPDGTEPEIRAKNFVVRKEKEGENISGFNAVKYLVAEEGLPLEKIWISPDLMISKDFDFISLSHFLNLLAQGAYAASFESSQEYFKLLEQGYPVKVEISRASGSQVSEVVSAKSVDLNSSDFSVPAGYSPSTLTSVGVWDGYM
jgi:hypothetical protein